MQTSKINLPEPNIVETYTFGESKVHICDNYMAKTPEEVQKVLKDMYSAAWKIVHDVRSKGGTI
ncbi:hypothetical protein RJP21_30050 [Paenibacillus sp. VCA1]|uniref:hypothetical protein n=1 Tax=Paenibacillus sp. VCA1 TaxID=3039148 RepID=UPI0028720B94|nr:hypothetical protein [Paenibacillus sp. VCA1]MDR9857839.1 hypothetical protein [Paenibacillus sp. VCA1]